MRLSAVLFVFMAASGCTFRDTEFQKEPTSREPVLVQDSNLVPAEPAPQETKNPPQSRQQGSDWPQFLGPTANSVSSEKGILSPWPKDGLKIVWQKDVGMGYSVPSISKGSLYLFDRHGNLARLSCFDSITGALHWKFEYPTDYRDYYGYNNGPRCCPVVDDARVYIYGPEGNAVNDFYAAIFAR
jgi:hypothetical protein